MSASIWEAAASSANYEAEQAAREAVFNKIVPAGNWKGSIDCWIATSDLDACNEAARWFTGSELTVVAIGKGVVHVTAPGYYASVGA